MAQDLFGGGEQDTTISDGGTPNSVDPDNGAATNIVSAGAPQEPLTDEELREALEQRITELGRPPGGPNDPVTAEEIEWNILQHQWRVLTHQGYRGGFVDYMNSQIPGGNSFYDYSLTEQRALIGQHWRGFHTEAGRLGPVGVVEQGLEDLGIPTWAIPIVTRRPRPRTGGRGDRTNGRDRDRRNPCPPRR